MDCQDWWEDKPMGFKFDPTDSELICGYLRPKVRAGASGKDLIKVSDQVYKMPPWEFCTDLWAFRRHGKYYLYTELEKMSKNRVVRTVGSHWTWHASNSKPILGENNDIYNNKNGIIGYKKLLNFKKKGEGKQMKPTDWLMHEFSLPGEETTVLCVIQNKKKKEEMGSAYDTCPEPDQAMSFIDFDSTTSAGGDPCPAPAPAHEDQALDSEAEEAPPSKKRRSDLTSDNDLFSGGDPCPAPAHEDQALDLEEEEVPPSKKMRFDPKLVDHPVSVASNEFMENCPELPDLREFMENFPELPDLFELPDLLESPESGSVNYVLLDDLDCLPNDVLAPFEGDS